MSDLPTILPELDEASITKVIDHLRLLTLGKGADYVTPADIQTNLEPLAQWYPDDATMQMVLDEIWRKVKDMHTATGQAVTWIAVQQSMIEDLHNQRDLALDYDTTVSEIMADQSHMLLNALEACGCEEDEADMFLQVFCDHPERLPDSVKELIRQAVVRYHTLKGSGL